MAVGRSGRSNSQKKNVVHIVDSDDGDGVNSSSVDGLDVNGVSGAADREVDQIDREMFLDEFLDALFEKRGSTREKALAKLIEAFSTSLQHEFVEKKFATLLHQCLSSFKRGSAKEVAMAAHLIGLLALTTGPGARAQEILEQSIPPISEALKSRTAETPKTSSLLECLAIVTFVGAGDPEQTEKSMQVMWQIAHPKQGPNLTPAVSAWSFLLTTVDGWSRNNHNNIWQESIAYLSSLLDRDERSVRIGAGEALALLFEIGMDIEGHLRGRILNQMRDLSAEAAGKGIAKKGLHSQRNTFRDILNFLDDGYSSETSTKIGGESSSLKTTSWAQLMQLNFLKNFLGEGFVKHILENEFLHDVFDFVPVGAVERRRLSASEKRWCRSPNSGVNKARTQFLNKQRQDKKLDTSLLV